MMIMLMESELALTTPRPKDLIFQIYEGTSQIQRLIISREIMKEVM